MDVVEHILSFQINFKSLQSEFEWKNYGQNFMRCTSCVVLFWPNFCGSQRSFCGPSRKILIDKLKWYIPLQCPKPYINTLAHSKRIPIALAWGLRAKFKFLRDFLIENIWERLEDEFVKDLSLFYVSLLSFTTRKIRFRTAYLESVF
jgi:hypothetical protein